MDYSPDAYALLVAEIDRQGGARLPDAHLSEDVEFTTPPYTKHYVFRAEDDEGTCGCGNYSRYVNTYVDQRPPHEANVGNAEGFVTACAVCDSMGGWPRFQRAFDELDDDEKPRDHF